MTQAVFDWFYSHCVAHVRASKPPPSAYSPACAKEYLSLLESEGTASLTTAHELLHVTAHAIAQLLFIKLESSVSSGPHALTGDPQFPLPYPSKDAHMPNLYAPARFITSAFERLSREPPADLHQALSATSCPELSFSWPPQPNPDTSLHLFVSFQEDCATKLQDIFYILSSKPKLAAILHLPSLLLLASPSSHTPTHTSAPLLALALHALYFAHWLAHSVLPLLMRKASTPLPLTTPLLSLLFSSSLSLAALSPLTLAAETHTEQQPLLYTRLLTAILPLLHATTTPLRNTTVTLTSISTQCTDTATHTLTADSACPLHPHLTSLQQLLPSFTAHFAGVHGLKPTTHTLANNTQIRLSPPATSLLITTPAQNPPPPHTAPHKRALAAAITAIAGLSPALLAAAAQSLAATAADEDALTLLLSLPTSLIAVLKTLLLRVLVYNERAQQPFSTPTVEPEVLTLSELLLPSPEISLPEFLPSHPPKDPYQATICVEKIAELTTIYDQIQVSPGVSSTLGISQSSDSESEKNPIPLSSPLQFTFSTPATLHIADIVTLILRILPPVLEEAPISPLPSSLSLTLTHPTLALASTAAASPLSLPLCLLLIALAHAAAPVPLQSILTPPRAHYPFQTHAATVSEGMMRSLLCLPSPLPLPPSIDKDNSTINLENDWHPSHAPLCDDLTDVRGETVAPVVLAILCPDPVGDAGDGYSRSTPVDGKGSFRGETATDGWWVRRLLRAQAFLVRVFALSLTSDTQTVSSASTLPLSPAFLIARYLLRRPVPETLALLEALLLHPPPPLVLDMMRTSAYSNGLALIRRALWVWAMEEEEEDVRRHLIGCSAPPELDIDEETVAVCDVDVDVPRGTRGQRYEATGAGASERGHSEYWLLDEAYADASAPDI